MRNSEAHPPKQTRKRHGQFQPDAPDAAATSGTSARERDIQYAKRLVEQTPDVREDRVAAAQQALKSGRLCLSGTELAERLFADDLHREDFSGV